MFGGLLSALYSFTACCIVEFVFFIVVDTVAKTLLHDAKDEGEKRHIWLFESLVLLCISLCVYLLNHTPVMLVTLSVATFSYTQLRGKVNFRYWWNQLAARWDEFQQHSESMEMQEQLQRRVLSSLNQDSSPSPVNHQHQPVNPNFEIPPMPAPLASTGYDVPQNMTGVTRHAGGNVWNTRGPEKIDPATSDWFIPGPGYTTTTTDNQMRWRPLVPMAGVRPPGSCAQPRGVEPSVWLPVSGPGPQFTPFQVAPPHTSSTPVRHMGWNPQNLGRKPLAGYQARVQAGLVPASPSTGSSWKSRVMSVLGINPYKSMPAGLVNGGQNLCFMNSVLQCVARSPKLQDGLINAQSDLHACTQQEVNFITSLTEVMHHLSACPGTSEISKVDPVALRQSVSILNPLLVAPPMRGQQRQQDAAEFLMWILQALHRCIKANTVTNHNSGNENENAPLKNSMDNNNDGPSLRMLKLIYGDLTSDLLENLKDSSRKEIEAANGLDDESYVEPIRRLSDLEWLSYKQQNKSVIDDLFTGQMVESQHCKACNRVSVSIQTFNILPVSITEGQGVSALTHLEDCFNKFCKVEELCGPDGLRCECCQKPANNQLLVTPRGKRIVSVVSPTDNNHHVMSPQLSSPLLANGRPVNMTKRRLPTTTDSVISSPSHTTAGSIMSPIRSRGESLTNNLNDSGFQDNPYRTSTPIMNSPSQLLKQPPPVRLTDGQRRSLLRQLPECLIVQLMRFSYIDGEIRKIHRPVAIPKTDMDLTNLLYDAVINREEIAAAGFNYKYNLYGVCMHLGGENTSYGHYVAFSLAADGQWYKLDDESVSRVNMDYQLSTKQLRENAYLLFYRKAS